MATELVIRELPKGSDPEDFWWRADFRNYCSVDEYGDVVGRYSQLEVYPLRVEKVTPKGVVLQLFGFVKGTAKKQKATPTPETAIRDLMARKRLHAHMADLRAQRAKRELETVQKADEYLATDSLKFPRRRFLFL